jgi:hypothetical protein
MNAALRGVRLITTQEEPVQDSAYKPVTVGQWLLTFLLLCIPIVNIILLFVWAFGSNTPISKANWAKAALIWVLISIVFYVLLFVIIGVGAKVASGL